jgi:cellular nucleic acid-binding protein
MARDCPHGLCFNCLRPGHQSRLCQEPRGVGKDAQVGAKTRAFRGD